jgi:hypothetical protein
VPIIPEILAGSLKTLLIVAEPLYGKGTSDFCRFARKQEVPGGSLKTSGSRKIYEDIIDSFRYLEDTTGNFNPAEHMYSYTVSNNLFCKQYCRAEMIKMTPRSTGSTDFQPYTGSKGQLPGAGSSC